MIHPARRLSRISGNSFRELTRLKRALDQSGKSYIDLSEGVPDLSPEETLIEKLAMFCRKSDSHAYPTRAGIDILRNAIMNHVRSEFGINTDALDCIPASGSKELIGHLMCALLNPGDVVLLPALHYPIYRVVANYCHANIELLPLAQDGSLLPVFEGLSPDIINRAKLMWINFPHNPTGATADRDYLKSVTAFCHANDIVLVNDMAYSHISYDICPSPSLLAAEQQHGLIELHSLSKTLNVPGWRCAFAVGDPEIIKVIEMSKSVFDTGMFIGMQRAMRYALANFSGFSRKVCDVYRERIDYVVGELDRHGVRLYKPRGGIYVWCEVANHESGRLLAEDLLTKEGLLVMPGEAFGPAGERHVRISVTQPLSSLEKAVEKFLDVY